MAGVRATGLLPPKARQRERQTPKRGGLALVLANSLALLLAPSINAPAGAPKREKIAVMKVEAPELSKAAGNLLRALLEEGVSLAVGTRLQVITRDSAAANLGGGEKLAPLGVTRCAAQVDRVE